MRNDLSLSPLSKSRNQISDLAQVIPNLPTYHLQSCKGTRTIALKQGAERDFFATNEISTLAFIAGYFAV